MIWMKVEISPSKVSGSITPPASKSFLHRAIIASSLSNGVSVIHNIDYSDDINATINAFKSMGVKIDKLDNKLVINSSGHNILNNPHKVYCNESGSTLRFLFPILTNNFITKFYGSSSLLNRPMTIYKDLFEKQNIYYKKANNCIVTKGKIKPGNFKIKGNISSQFVSGLLFILPILNKDSTIEIINNFESEKYVDMTIQMLEKFSVIIKKKNNKFYIKGNQTYKSSDIFIESDFSQLAFYAVLGTINNDILINNINLNSLQPDKSIIDFIKIMNGSIDFLDNSLLFKRSVTKGIVIDISQSPDIAPILSLLAALSKGKTNIINAERLVIKESNRLVASYNFLKQMGVTVTKGSDFLTIIGKNSINGGEFDSYNDHRIAMTLAIAGTISKTKITINNAEAINKSYPNFYKDLQSLGVKIKYL